jgi:hypothetical protein
MQQLDKHWIDFHEILYWRVMLKFVNTFYEDLHAFLWAELGVESPQGESTARQAPMQPHGGILKWIPHDDVINPLDTLLTQRSLTPDSSDINAIITKRSKVMFWHNKQTATHNCEFYSIHKLEL